MTAHTELAEALADAVRRVPGVAFLKPGIADRLRSALPRPTGRAAGAGLRVSRADGPEGWRVEVQIVTLADARALEVARDARAAVGALLADAAPSGRAQILVTVTGIV
jgi:hypothetical protein